MRLRIQDLYTFYIVARSGSMQDGAHELGVTPGAISQRIRALEDRHGQRLFHRTRGGITLTPSGQVLWQEVSTGFATIEAAHQRHFSRTPAGVLRISAAPSFAHSFLVASLGAFTAAHPKARITLETEDRLVDLRREPIDLAIRHGLGRYPGLHAEWLCAPELILVASPDLLSSHPPVTTAADCLNLPLLPDETGRDWALWFAAQGVDDHTAKYVTAFKDGFLTVKAAVGGQGLALLNDIYVREELADGRLVQLLGGSWPTRFAYYAVGLPGTFQRPLLKTFLKWLHNALAAA